MKTRNNIHFHCFYCFMIYMFQAHLFCFHLFLKCLNTLFSSAAGSITARELKSERKSFKAQVGEPVEGFLMVDCSRFQLQITQGLSPYQLLAMLNSLLSASALCGSPQAALTVSQEGQTLLQPFAHLDPQTSRYGSYGLVGTITWSGFIIQSPAYWIFFLFYLNYVTVKEDSM